MATEVKPTRRPHKKSRTGCRNCKSRRLKCDEVQPRCGNCAKQGTLCDYERVGVLHSATPAEKIPIPRIASSTGTRTNDVGCPMKAKTAIPTSPATVATGSPYFPGPHSDSRMLELRLFDYFMARVRDIESFPLYVRPMLQIIPAVALESNYLMDAVLSLAANLLRVDVQADERALQAASHSYMARSIGNYRKTLESGVSYRNFDAAYMTSLLIAFHTLQQRQHLPVGKDGDQGLHQWLQAFRGLKVIIVLSPDGLTRSQVATSFPAAGSQSPFYKDLDLSTAPGHVFAFLVEDVNTRIPDIERVAYQHTVALLTLLYLSPSRGMMMRFLLDPHPDFVACVARGISKARLLMGVYLCLYGFADVDANLARMAQRDVRHILQILPSTDARLLRRAMAMIQGRSTQGTVSIS
ncbi:hypothetical protein BJ170DRAFT_428517 [Xylariales sp. AK1849]|nr:hypothetical protein BJ170DRAFT_428517 [Xylariales sp. AK1849]